MIDFEVMNYFRHCISERYFVSKHSAAFSDHAEVVITRQALVRYESYSLANGRIIGAFEYRRAFMNFVQPLEPIGSGSIAVSPDADGIKICYSFRFTELFVVVTVMVAAFFGPPMWRAPNLDEFDTIAILGTLWLWLFGGNFAITSYRLPKLLRKVAREAVDSVSGSAST